MTLLTPASAGSYGMPHYSGGTARSNCGGGGTYCGSSGGGGADTVSSAGPITATFTWQPNDPANPQSDPPPQSVTVTQTCVANWSSQGAPAPVGSCGNGLGDAPTHAGPTPVSGSPGTYQDSGASGLDGGGRPVVHISTQPGGATVTVTCPASASGSATTAQIAATVTYTAVAGAAGSSGPGGGDPGGGNPGGGGPGGGGPGGGPGGGGPGGGSSDITITFPNATTISGVQEELTGQPITAVMNYTGPYTVDSVSWSIDNPNDAFIYTTGGYIGQQAQGTTTPFPPFQAPSFTLYSSDPGELDFTANVTLTYGDGSTGTEYQTAPIIIAKPTLTTHVFSIVESDDFPTHHNDTSSSYGAVETWQKIQITDPPGFTQGSGSIVQKVVSTSRVDKRSDGNPDYTQHVKLPNGTWVTAASLVPGLDTDFPYPFAGDGNGNVRWPVTTVGIGGDAPEIFCAPPLVYEDPGDPAKPKWNKSVADDHFTDWIMFNPDPTNNQNIWVPVDTFNWYWTNTATLNTTTNTWQQSQFLGDDGNHSLGSTDVWPTWNTWVPYSKNIITGDETGNLAMRP